MNINICGGYIKRNEPDTNIRLVFFLQFSLRQKIHTGISLQISSMTDNNLFIKNSELLSQLLYHTIQIYKKKMNNQTIYVRITNY